MGDHDYAVGDPVIDYIGQYHKPAQDKEQQTADLSGKDIRTQLAML